MPDFFHVSRRDISTIALFEKKHIDNEKWYVENPGKLTKEEYISYLSSLYPEGTTRHGEQYLLSRWPSGKGASGEDLVSNNNSLEAIFEIVRRFKFPEVISRFESVFGCKSIDDARKIRDVTFNGEGTIYKVECERFFEADMSLLLTGHFFISAMIFAEKYWAGKTSENPFIEILMYPPVKILGKVN